MTARKTNRREFLGLTGASLAGLALTAGALSLPGGLTASVAANQKPPLEEWLLDTGRATLSPGVYNHAFLRINGQQAEG